MRLDSLNETNENMVVEYDSVDLALDTIKVILIAVIGFVLFNAWFRNNPTPSVIITEPIIDILIFLVILCVAMASWIIGYLYRNKQINDVKRGQDE